MKFRTSPDGYALTKGFIWGIGAGFPSRSNLKVVTEMSGEAYFDLAQTFTGTQTDNTPPATWGADATRDIFAGLQYHMSSGVYLGAGVNYAASHLWDRKNFETRETDNQGQDKWAFQVRLGYHPGVRVYVPPPPPAPPPPPVWRRPTARRRSRAAASPARSRSARPSRPPPTVPTRIGDALTYGGAAPPARSPTPTAARRSGRRPGRPARCR